ncbi:MAG: hypothetical protein ABL888_15055 [Pirellulaceae bacterium]
MKDRRAAICEEFFDSRKIIIRWHSKNTKPKSLRQWRLLRVEHRVRACDFAPSSLRSREGLLFGLYKTPIGKCFSSLKTLREFEIDEQGHRCCDR